MNPWPLKWILINLPNRDELSLRLVAALPKVSKIGLAFKSCLSSSPRSMSWPPRVIPMVVRLDAASATALALLALFLALPLAATWARY